MKITLIEPAMIKRRGFSEKGSFVIQPLTLGALAGLTPPGIQVQLIDDRIEDIDYNEPRDLVGISVKTYTARRAYQIAAQFRSRGVPVVLGGYHPTLLPEEAGQHADAVVVGEAEGVWAGLLTDARTGQLQKLYCARTSPPFENIHIERSAWAGKPYLPLTLLEATRGCPHDCAFCSGAIFSGRRHRRRPVEEVAAEVASLADKLICFVDDNLTADSQAARDLFTALIPLRIRWIGQVTLSALRDRHLMRQMQASGCQGVLVGMETIDPHNLRQIGKRWNSDPAAAVSLQPDLTAVGYARALQNAYEHGIAVAGSFMIGLDADTPESLEATLEFAISQRLFVALFNLLTPYPGTRLYAELLRHDRLLRPNWWIDPSYTFGSVVYRPRHLSPEALAEKHMDLYRRFYGAGSIARRLLNLPANARNLWRLATFLGLNLPANREEAQRFGQPLGTEETEAGQASMRQDIPVEQQPYPNPLSDEQQGQL